MIAALWAALSAAAALWVSMAGITPPPVNSVTVEDLDRAIAGIAPDRDQPGCILFVDPIWEHFPYEFQVHIMAHELGHCIGLWDHFGSGLMSGAVAQWTAEDILRAQDVTQTRPYRAFVVVSRE